MKNNFENSIKNKVEQFDGMPPENVWTGVSQKLKNNTMENKSKNYSKIWMGVAVAAVIILAAIFWKLNSSEKTDLQPDSPKAIAQKVMTGGKGETVHDLFPTELKMAKEQGKGIMAYVCMENCKFCTKFVNETLSKSAVHEYLEERFIQVAVDLKDEENKAFLKKHEIEAAPIALFFAADGTYLDKNIGARGTEYFMKVAESAWQMINGISTDAVQIDTKIFPNPNNGNFNIQLNAADGPIEIKVFDESGKEIYQERQNDFSGSHEGTINLQNAQKGFYYLKIIQGQQISTQKIIVQ